jgi:hypothetical protein
VVLYEALPPRLYYFASEKDAEAMRARGLRTAKGHLDLGPEQVTAVRLRALLPQTDGAYAPCQKQNMPKQMLLEITTPGRTWIFWCVFSPWFCVRACVCVCVCWLVGWLVGWLSCVSRAVRPGVATQCCSVGLRLPLLPPGLSPLRPPRFACCLSRIISQPAANCASRNSPEEVTVGAPWMRSVRRLGNIEDSEETSHF